MSGSELDEFLRSLEHAIDQAEKGQWLNVLWQLNIAQRVALHQFYGVLKGSP